MASGDYNQVVESLRKHLVVAVTSIQWSYAIFWSISPAHQSLMDLHCSFQSASIQTIVCFPHLGGVVELGTTELVPEDPNLIQHVKSTFLDSPSTVPKILNHVSNSIANDNLVCEVLDHVNMTENELDQFLISNDLDMCSPKDSSGDFADNLLRDESNFVEAIDGEVSQLRSLPFMDEAISNCRNNSTNSSGCVSQTHEIPANVPLSDGKNMRDNSMNGAQECIQQKQNSSDHVHYHSVLSTLLKSSRQLILGPYFRNGNRESSFVSWKKDATGANVPKIGTPQRLLKKVLFEVAIMHQNSQLESTKRNGKKDAPKAEDEVDRNHVLSEGKRRENINERFTILGSLVPSGGKVDKVSILDHTIEYLRELERKVEELQSERESTTQTKPHDAVERTSDNYGASKIDNLKKPPTNKRKVCDPDTTVTAKSRPRLRDSLTDNNITINIYEKDVLIEISCSSRDNVLLGVMEAISKLGLETERVQSSNTDGMLSLTINAKGKGLKVPSVNVIRQALERVIRNA